MIPCKEHSATLVLFKMQKISVNYSADGEDLTI